MVSLPLWTLVAATLGWCWAALRVSFTMARRGGGKNVGITGLFLVLPFMILSALVPWANVRVAINFTYCWVTPCKLFLLYAANFPIDFPAWALSEFSHFLPAVLLPVRIKGPVKGAVRMHMQLRTLVVELGALMAFFCLYESMGTAVRHGAHCMALYLVLDLPHRIASMGFVVLGGVETYPTFEKPWLSTSLTDFWGTRWDLTANALLRHSVYNPIINLLTRNTIDIQLLHLPSAAPDRTPAQQSGAPRAKVAVIKPLALVSRPSTHKPLPLSVRLIGVNTTFFVSGLIHELLYFCLTQAGAPTWEVTSFFIVHGLATSAEITLRRAFPKHIAINFNMPRPLKIVFTMCFMYATTASLFFPQLVRAGTFLKCTSEYKAIQEVMGITSLNTKMLLTLGSDVLY